MPDSKAPATIDNDEKAAEALRFQHQCYLAAHWEYFARHNVGRVYENFICMAGEPTVLTERLAAIPNAANFINAPPVLLSSLVPMIQIGRAHV